MRFGKYGSICLAVIAATAAHAEPVCGPDKTTTMTGAFATPLLGLTPALAAASAAAVGIAGAGAGGACPV